MEIKILSHACARIEIDGVRLVTDPWLEGNCFFGGWSLYPPAQFQPQDLEVDHILISHWHVDHLHKRSLLNHFPLDTSIIIPKFPVSWMPQYLSGMGFKNVKEISHGSKFELGSDVSVKLFQTSYQDDSAMVIKGRSNCVINLNDAKPEKVLAKQIKKAAGMNVDVVLRSHSYAWSYPTKFDLSEANKFPKVDAQSYIDSFIKDTCYYQPKSIIAFASGISHLHELNFDENQNAVTFERLSESFSDARLIDGRSGAVVKFDRNTGYELLSYPILPCDKAVFLANERKITLKNDVEINLAKKAIKKSIERFHRKTSWLRRTLLKRNTDNVAFKVRAGEKFEILYYSFDQGLSKKQSSKNLTVYDCPAELFYKSFRTLTFTNLDISKLWQVKIIGDATTHFLFTALFSLYEAGYFDRRKVLTKRAFVQFWLRRAEYLFYLKEFLRLALLKKSIEVDRFVD